MDRTSFDITGETAVFGIIGSPVSHSLSPVLQNTLSEYMELDTVYVPFPVDPGQTAQALRGAFSLGIRGFNVTAPHKEEVMAALSEIHPQALMAGAVNTLRLTENGYVGYNTDITGIIRTFKEHGINLSGKTVVIIGAGGAARAAAFAATKEKAGKLFIVNRTLSRARELMENLLEHFPEADVEILNFEQAEAIKSAHVLIQATTLGMSGENPLSGSRLLRIVPFIMDLIYSPWETPLLAEARQAGAEAVNGFEMLIYQGIASFELWHNKKVPESVAKKVLRDMKQYIGEWN